MTPPSAPTNEELAVAASALRRITELALESVHDSSGLRQAIKDDAACVEETLRAAAARLEESGGHVPTDDCGFDRDASINEDRYVCMCDWRSPESGGAISVAVDPSSPSGDRSVEVHYLKRASGDIEILDMREVPASPPAPLSEEAREVVRDMQEAVEAIIARFHHNDHRLAIHADLAALDDAWKKAAALLSRQVETIERLERENDGREKELVRAETAFLRQAAEIEGLRKDAERYRTLRAQNSISLPRLVDPFRADCGYTPEGVDIAVDFVRAAIDAARAALKEGKP